MKMTTFGRKLLTISSLVIAIWLVIGVLIYRSSSINFSPDTDSRLHSGTLTAVEDEIEACTRKGQKLSHSFWRKINLNDRKIPQSLSVLVSEIKVQSNFTFYQDSKIHYLYAKPNVKKNLSILLLHGQSFMSQTWKKLKTIQNLAAFGYYTVAVDLPGYGHSPHIQNLNRTELLSSVITTLHLENVVIVSPSMSGSFSLDFLSQHFDTLAGFVPVSPVNSQVLLKSPCKSPLNDTHLHLDKDCKKVWPYLKSRPPNLSCIKVPTLVVFGEHDRGKNSARLCLLPNSQGAEIPNGQHAAYLSDPNLWHTLLYNFLDVLSKTLDCT